MRVLASKWSAATAFVLLSLGGVGLAGAAQAQVQAQAKTLTVKCEALAAADLSAVPDAPTHLNSAKLVAAAAGKPARCEVEGYVAPQVSILMWLPPEGWNGKFLEVGCGGFCGSLAWIGACEEPLKKGYACITTDMGHRSKEAEGVEWAYNNPQGVIDFAYRATHVTALAGKAIVQRYYGRKPDRSYFSGCSCGGRQALVEAERFPWDFDGIIVGAPGISYPDLALNFGLRARDLTGPDGKPLFDAAAIKRLNTAVVAKCDMNDGIKDGQIGDPRLCRFDPRDIVCASAGATGCLTADQVKAAIAFYSEKRSRSGERLAERRVFPGAEISFLGMVDQPTIRRSFYEDFFKYMAFTPNPGPSWRFQQFDLDADYKRMGMIQSLMDAGNPDLSRFKQAGGKLLMYHGWADGGVSPLTSIEFYKAVERTMGGPAATRDFARLFMVPDMDHCGAGKGPWVIDTLAALDTWVEHGAAPDVMIGVHFTDDPMSDRTFDPDKPDFARPVFAYPAARAV